jgi:hypothetical protein
VRGLKDDADVYTEDGQLLLRFRKGVLSQNLIDDAYTGNDILCEAAHSNMVKTTRE